jgi:glycosyltransferase involved in cell wall biosynthesis
MIVAYLVNQYPHVSHTFIRREIAGVEAAGLTVRRFAIRPPGKDLVDPADAAECVRTRSLLAAGKFRLLLAALLMLVLHPIRCLRAFRAAWRMGGAAGRRTRHLIYLVEACLLVRWLRGCGAGHLHTHFGTNPAAVALLARILGGPPYSFTVHGPEEFDRPEALSLRDKVAGAAFVVAISSFGRSQLYRWARLEDWGKVRLVRCGVDGAFLAAGPLPVPDVPRLVCVGRLAEQKGQLLLVAAVARLADAGRDVELVLAGDGPMRPDVERAIREQNLGDRVRITGWLSNDAVRAEMAAARAVVLPSFAEGLPVVLMEALVLGRPVVTTHIAGIPELVRHEVNGWLVPAGDVAALTAALGDALGATPDELAAMGAAGAKAARAAHDASREAAKLAALFTNAGRDGEKAVEAGSRRAAGRVAS